MDRLLTKDAAQEIIARDNSAIKRMSETKDPEDELCLMCNHTHYYHLFGGKICGMVVGCACKIFIPSGEYFEYGGKR